MDGGEPAGAPGTGSPRNTGTGTPGFDSSMDGDADVKAADFIAQQTSNPAPVPMLAVHVDPNPEAPSLDEEPFEAVASGSVGGVSPTLAAVSDKKARAREQHRQHRLRRKAKKVSAERTPPADLWPTVVCRQHADPHQPKDLSGPAENGQLRYALLRSLVGLFSRLPTEVPPPLWTVQTVWPVRVARRRQMVQIRCPLPC